MPEGRGNAAGRTGRGAAGPQVSMASQAPGRRAQRAPGRTMQQPAGRRTSGYPEQRTQTSRGRRMPENPGGRMPGRMGGRMPERPRRVLTPTNLLAALIGFLFLFSASVVLVLNLRSIYYVDIRLQNLESQTGLSEEVIRRNYDTLIDYNLITKGVKTLEFPDFPMSQSGETHFREVKRIFLAVQCLCALTGVLLAAVLFRKLRRRDYGSLKLISVLTVVVPVVVGILAVGNWSWFFVAFHELFFDNDYWIFNPVTDPVIRILPDVFFFHCAVAILLFVLLGGLLCGACYRFATRRYRRQRYR